MRLPPQNALLVIDLQKAIDDPSWAKDGPRNNPEAEANIARLLAAWRASRAPLFHIRHDSVEPQSVYRPGQQGNAFKPEAMPRTGETIIAKRTNSAFIGTDLEPRLRAAGITSLVVAGVITNNSVEATVRMAGNLGFETILVADACFTFARRDYDGRLRSAEEVHAMSLANLDGEYCRVVRTADVLATVGATVRAYAPADLDALIEIFRSSVRQVACRDYTEDQVKAWAPDTIDREAFAARRAAKPTFVAVIGAKPVGFADLEPDGHIDMLFVDAEHQRRGVARALFEAIEAAAKDQGLAGLHTEASITARRFFERCGFSVVEPQTVTRRGQQFRNFKMAKPLSEE
ncbi:MAG: isochorismatase family protein [Proteobacteria bacterium]|nr:isochorismatase family protein [Pseudomonadota bacterium]MBI3497838.1 isochorismatase family protein [Pseudomonadota bacterium]